MTRPKLLLAICFISSCTSFTYTDSAKYLVGYFSSFETDVISNEYYLNQKYSFANVKIGRGPASTIVLAYINGDTYEWRSADNIKIYTINERIVRTTGFETDSRFFYTSSPSFVDGNTGVGTVSFRNPDLIRSNFTYKISRKENSEISRFDETIEVEVFEELIEVSSIRWSTKNIYFIKDGKVLRTVSKINPRLPQFKIDYYYK